jgi:hypothetical protein
VTDAAVTDEPMALPRAQALAAIDASSAQDSGGPIEFEVAEFMRGWRDEETDRGASRVQKRCGASAIFFRAPPERRRSCPAMIDR